ALTKRNDDQDEVAIDKRHSIYYDAKTGTLAATYYFRDLAAKDGVKYVTLAGEKDLKSVTNELVSKL
ncbi:MAG: adenylate kinase, partial [Desulfobacula sp.]